VCRNEARSSAIQLTPAVNIRASRLCALYHLSHHINLTNKEEKKKNQTLTLMQTLSILLCSSYSGKSYEHPPFQAMLLNCHSFSILLNNMFAHKKSYNLLIPPLSSGAILSSTGTPMGNQQSKEKGTVLRRNVRSVMWPWLKTC